MRRLLIKKNPVFFLFLLITTSSLTILIFSLLRLPESPPIIITGKLRADLSDELGFFGNTMVEMLPEDLVFTAFVPSEKAFNRDLGMTKPNNTRKSKSLEDEENTYAVVSRILGFAVVPYRVEAGDVGKDETASYESLSGFTLKIWRKSGGLVVNGVETEKMGLKRGKIMVHIMDGVIMDSDFSQSVASTDTTPQDEEEPKP
ncbi:unnamed protein product [Brassica rapa]|uniref:FAS1 domain-containing protein n=2 Tax=Brassica TaxID=3705 RepID=A0A3P5YN23_BRACM|nr:unnamed protein product [Brassica napus]CAG7865669.1 unnamed protein product [Brassica rapa]CDY27263.1 BnaA09g35390D [Brassica napus]VDC62723.1 unnamed protein product [Brassica rapa]